MNSQTVLSILRQHKVELATRFDINYLALFGSVSRDSASVSSDIDILVDFNGPATSSRYYGLQFYLEDLFGRPIDLVTTKGVRAELKPYIEKDALRV